MLWDRSLVMRDLETGGLWSHILGECRAGPLRGTRLAIVPAVVTSWNDWQWQHPETSVLALNPTASEFRSEIIAGSPDVVYGIRVGGASRAYPFDVLRDRRIVQETVAEIPVVIVHDPESTRTRAFDRRVNGRTLQFIPTDPAALVDESTGRRWDPTTGAALDDSEAGSDLRVIDGLISYRRAWEVFHPNATFHPRGSPQTHEM